MAEGTVLPVAAAAALGWAKKQGYKIPEILGMGPAGSSAIILWALGKWGKSPAAAKAAVGMACVAAYSWGKGEGVAGIGGIGVGFDED